MNGYLSETKVLNMINCVKNGTFEDNIKMVKNIIDLGYSVNNCLEQLFEKIILDEEITDKMKSKIVIHYSDNQQKIVECSDEYIQFMDIIIKTYMIINNLVE